MIGIDIVDIDRIEESAKKETFLKKVFTESELEYYSAHGSRAETLAGMFAVKEAVAKALGTGFNGFGFVDIEVGHELNGKPYAILYNYAAVLLGNKVTEISVSHSTNSAVAVCIISGG